MYRPDPGGVFASDTHRRVLAHLPLPDAEPMDLHPLGHRISPDRHHGLSHVDDLQTVLHELANDGHCTNDETGWQMTQAGLDALNAPAPADDGPVRPAVIEGLDPSHILGATASPPPPAPEED